MSDQTSIHKLIILGAGPAGLTAAIYASRSHLKPLVIVGPKPGGQLMGTTLIENWPGSSSIMGPELMINMQKQAAQLETLMIDGSATSIIKQDDHFEITLNSQKKYKAYSMIIATGATPNKLKCAGEEEFWGKGVSTCAVCDGAFYHNKKIIVVGGGDSAMENASFLQKNNNQISIIHIGPKLTASPIMQERVLNKPAYTIIYNSTVTAIHGTNGHVSGVTITNMNTQEKTMLEADAVFLSIGLKPNTTMLPPEIKCSGSGHILVSDLVKTSIAGIFAAGDVQDPRYRQAIVSAGFGCIAALEAERYLATIMKD